MAPSKGKKSKTSRFPVARIKKIMQLDEEVGKLASATPVMISKSLECFLQLLLDETAKETRKRGSKKVTAWHLKQTIITNPTLDFLLPLTAAIPDPLEPSTTPGAGPSRRKVSGGPGSGASGRPEGVKGKRKRSARPGRPTGDPDGDDDDDDEDEEEEGEGGGAGVPDKTGGLPEIGTWKKEMSGGGGTGEGGKGMFDDYEEEEDDY